MVFDDGSVACDTSGATAPMRMMTLADIHMIEVCSAEVSHIRRTKIAEFDR